MSDYLNDLNIFLFGASINDLIPIFSLELSRAIHYKSMT